MATIELNGTKLYASDPHPPASWRWRALAAVALVAALALLAMALAHWGWRWFGPAALTLPPERSDSDPVRRIADAHLFGTAAAPAATEPSVAIGDLKLLGVFAERDGAGYALFRAGSRGALFVAAGGEVAPGTRLEAVAPDGVTLLQNGARRQLVLGPTRAAEGKRIAAAPNRSAQCTAPSGFSGPVVRLNAELLSGMIAAPDTWKALVQPVTGGLAVRDQSGFAGMMGLRSGDHVERANGIALALPDDVAGAVLRPLTRSQQVWVTGTRDGKPQQWLYLNAGACPS
ncbi:MAG TPA: type II secretion system protein N [Casimicrobiaceae bacterium]|nr:type II secretion system protein N [Casimicrobiaceae bacterium]